MAECSPPDRLSCALVELSELCFVALDFFGCSSQDRQGLAACWQAPYAPTRGCIPPFGIARLCAQSQRGLPAGHRQIDLSKNFGV